MAVTLFGPASELAQGTNVWRYMKLSTLLLLASGKAFFPSITKLQESDPLEGEIHCEPLWFRHAIESRLGREEAVKMDSWLSSNGLALSKWGSLPLHLNQQFQMGSYKSAVCARRAAWCWVQQSGESAAMWSIYANAGVAVSSTLGKLCESLPSDCEFMIAKIRYIDDDFAPVNRENPQDQEEAILRPHLAKLASYRHEQELRVVTRCRPSSNGVMVKGLNSQMLVERIVISPLLHFEEAKQLQGVMRTHFPQSDISRSDLRGRQRNEEEEDRAALHEAMGSLGIEPTIPDESELPAPIRNL